MEESKIEIEKTKLYFYILVDEIINKWIFTLKFLFFILILIIVNLIEK